jgi:hypothetical protein
MSHGGEKLDTKNCVGSSRISTNVLSRQTDVFTIPELVIRILYMLKLILKRLSVTKKQERSPRNYHKENSLKIILCYAFGTSRPVASVVLQAGLYLFGYSQYTVKNPRHQYKIFLFLEKKLL